LPLFFSAKRCLWEIPSAHQNKTKRHVFLKVSIHQALARLFSAAMGRHVQRLVAHCPRVARLQQFGLAGVMTALAAYLFLTERPTTKT
jgi:hypothetical protein